MSARRLILLILGGATGYALTRLGLATSTTNLLGWFLIIIGVSYFTGGSIYVAFYRNPSAVRRESGDLSTVLVAPGFLAIFFIPPLEYLYLPACLPHTRGMQILGIALLGAGLLLRLWVRLALGRFYSSIVQVKADHRVVRQGPYQVVRHPGYTSFLLMGLGLAVGFSSLIGLLAVPLVLLPGLVYRLTVEEKFLTEQFGDEYHRYAQRTKRLIPGLW